MVELIGDPCFPGDLGLPILTTAQIDALTGAALLSGLIVWNSTLKKIDVFDGTNWETVTSAGR